MSGSSREGVSIRDGDKHFIAIRERSPIPPSGQVKEYESVLSGAAERMLSMAERQQAHRLAEGSKTGDRNHFLAVCGQWIVAFLCLCCIAVAAAGVFLDHPHAVYLGGVAAVCIIALSAISRKK